MISSPQADARQLHTPRVRAFTLLEVAITIALLAGLASLAMSMLVFVTYGGRTIQARYAAARQADFITAMVARDVQRAGTGLSRKLADNHQRTAHFTPHGTLTLLADYPPPGATRSNVLQVVAVSADRMALVLAAPEQCIASNDATCTCATGNLTDASCPWVASWPAVSAVRLLITAPEGSAFVDVPLQGGAAAVPLAFVNVGSYVGVVLAAALPSTLMRGDVAGMTTAAQLDRLYYVRSHADGTPCDDGVDHSNCSLYRRQCWGTAAIESSALTDFALGPGTAPPGCQAGVEGTAWELLATQVSLLDFSREGSGRHSAIRTDVSIVRRVPGTSNIVTGTSTTVAMPGGLW